MDDFDGRTLFQAPQNDHTLSSVDTLRLFNNDRRRAGFVIDINFANPVNPLLIPSLPGDYYWETSRSEGE